MPRFRVNYVVLDDKEERLEELIDAKDSEEAMKIVRESWKTRGKEVKITRHRQLRGDTNVKGQPQSTPSTAKTDSPRT